ncbi:GAF and ANTAR domain-containing protein [Streptomyces sp. TRM68416]|nr:GAF and ANTAR domain-containing protein [Streptomyces sp. TRM68416]MBD0841845.1 GAF and ANTAR domain-containing protein [Streptomyces sp. TRM68416]
MHHTVREIHLAEALVKASDTLTDGFDADDYLRRVCDLCVELLAARAVGIMLIDEGRTVSLTGSGGRRGAALDLLRAQSDGGPCEESYGSGEAVRPVSIRIAHAGSRWPAFTERALRYDIAATFAVPLRCRERLLGALNVFVPTLPDDCPGAREGELRLAQALADAAAVGLQNHQAYAQYRTLAGQLQQALSSRVCIEQAKGMLAERWQTGADQAFAVLRQYARRHRLPLDQVARSVVERSADDAGLRREAAGRLGRRP